MLHRLHVRHFTVFADAEFKFSPGLNVIVGTNGTGKSHVLKLGYTVELAYASAPRKIENVYAPTGESTGLLVAVHLISRLDEVFASNGLDNLIRRPNDKAIAAEFADVKVLFGENEAGSFAFTITPSDTRRNELSLYQDPVIAGKGERPVFIPAKEMLSLMPGIIGLSDKYDPLLDLTYTNLARSLVIPLLKSPPDYVQNVLAKLGEIMQGRIEAENGRFYLQPDQGERIEINLVAEGYRKLGTLAYLLANGSLSKDSTLFWDEPEANLNPTLLREVARLLVELANFGFQIVLATHSLFLLKELHILSRRAKQNKARYFGLFKGPEGDTQVETTDDFELLQHITALDAELYQAFDYEETLDQDDANDTRG